MESIRPVVLPLMAALAVLLTCGAAASGLPDGPLDIDLLPLSIELLEEFSVPVLAIPLVTDEMIEEAKLEPERFGLEIPFTNAPVDMVDSAVSVKVNGGGHLYMLALESKGALSLGVEFEELNFETGASMFVSSLEGGQLVINADDLRPNRVTYHFSTDLLSGHIVYLQFYVPPGIDHIATITSLVHDFVGYGISKNKKLCDPDLECAVDSACYEDELQDQINGVVRLTISGQACSGVLVADPELERVLVLTASHCQGNNDQNAKVWFHERRACEASGTSGNCQSVGEKVVGLEAIFDATTEMGDIVLMQFLGEQDVVADILLNLEAGPAYYNGWSTIAEDLATPMATLSHPQNDFQKVTIQWGVDIFGNATPATDYVNEIVHFGTWDVGVVSAGSSGGGLFSLTDGLLYGIVTAGDGCTESTPCGFLDSPPICNAMEVFTVMGKIGLSVKPTPSSFSLPLQEALSPSDPSKLSVQGSYCPFGQFCPDYFASMGVQPPPCMMGSSGTGRKLSVYYGGSSFAEETTEVEEISESDDVEVDCSLHPMMPPPVPCEYAGTGDVNMDGILNILDVVQIISFIIGKDNVMFSACQVQAANVANSDMMGSVDIIDVVTAITQLTGRR